MPVGRPTVVGVVVSIDRDPPPPPHALAAAAELDMISSGNYIVGLDNGEAEVTRRADGDTRTLPLADVVATLSTEIAEQRDHGRRG